MPKKEEETKEYRYKVKSEDVVKKVKEIIEEGNATRISILNQKNEKVMEFSLTIGAVSVILAPILAAVGAFTAIATKCTIVVEKRK